MEVEKNKKKKKKENNFFKKYWKMLVPIVIAFVLVLVGGYYLSQYNINKSNETVDIDYLGSILSKSADLTTATLKTTGVYHFSDNGVKVIYRSDFQMVYTVTIKAGIDIQKVKITKNDTKRIVNITIPKATIKEATVDPKSIRYFDTGLALFNPDEKEDANRAQEWAAERAKKDAEDTGILKMADAQSETLLRGILANAIPKDYTIKFNRGK